MTALEGRGQLEVEGTSRRVADSEQCSNCSAMKKELKEALLERDSAEEAKRIFLSNTSHEILTPLNGILGATQILRHSAGLSPEQKDLVDIMHESGTILMSILGDILDFSRLNLGHVTLEPQPMQVRDLIEKSIDPIRSELESTDITVTYRLGKRVELKRFCFDSARLRQILVPLLKNAVKFNKPGGDITVFADVGYEDGGEVLQISVQDTGVGMSEKVLSMLFDSFAQGEGSRARLYGGCGLGLAIASKLAHVMGGNVSVKSTIDEGSTLTVTVPLIDDMKKVDSQACRSSRKAVTSNEGTSVDTDSFSDYNGSSESSSEVDGTDSPVDLKLQEDMQGLRCMVDVEHPGLKCQLSELLQVYGASVIPEVNNYDIDPVDVWITTGDNARQIIANGWRQKPLVLLGDKTDIPLAILPMARVVSMPLKYRSLFSAIKLSIKGCLDPTNVCLYRIPETLTNNVDSAAVYYRKSVDNSELQKNFFSSTRSQISPSCIPSTVHDVDAGSLRVLVAEDSEINIKIATKIIKHVRPNVYIDVVRTGLEVLRVTEENTYDLILMDIHMPEMDGLEATKLLRQRQENLTSPSIIALSADTVNELQEECFASGMNGFVSKPLQVEDVERLLQSMI